MVGWETSEVTEKRTVTDQVKQQTLPPRWFDALVFQMMQVRKKKERKCQVTGSHTQKSSLLNMLDLLESAAFLTPMFWSKIFWYISIGTSCSVPPFGSSQPISPHLPCPPSPSSQNQRFQKGQNCLYYFSLKRLFFLCSAVSTFRFVLRADLDENAWTKMRDSGSDTVVHFNRSSAYPFPTLRGYGGEGPGLSLYR